MKLSRREQTELRWLKNERCPRWGGHLQRKQPLTDQQMQSWLDRGLIRQQGMSGYVVTEKCLQLLQQTPGV